MVWLHSEAYNLVLKLLSLGYQSWHSSFLGASWLITTVCVHHHHMLKSTILRASPPCFVVQYESVWVLSGGFHVSSTRVGVVVQQVYSYGRMSFSDGMLVDWTSCVDPKTCVTYHHRLCVEWVLGDLGEHCGSQAIGLNKMQPKWIRDRKTVFKTRSCDYFCLSWHCQNQYSILDWSYYFGHPPLSSANGLWPEKDDRPTINIGWDYHNATFVEPVGKWECCSEHAQAVLCARFAAGITTLWTLTSLLCLMLNLYTWIASQ